MPVDLKSTNFDPTDPYYHPLLDDVQGNILKGHGRKYSVHLFIQFKDVLKGKQWLAGFAEKWVTSAIKQYQDARRYKMDPGKYANIVFGNFMLTATGYKILGYGPDNIPSDKRFQLGMKHNDVRSWLHDPPSEDWEESFQKPIHALILLACNLDPSQENQFTHQVNNIRDDINKFGEIIHTEYGEILREYGDSGQAVEHFGYVDGLSQPLFYDYDIKKAQKSAGRGLWDASAPLNLVLTRDPLGQYEDSCGSYFVYRKLQQDVDRFKNLMKDLSEHLDGDVEYAEAAVVGRFRDGTPLIQYNKPQRSGDKKDRIVPNNFTYDNDRKGRKCPFHAHIRKVNPRGEKHDERFTRLLRFLAQFQWLRNLVPSLDESVNEMDKMERSRRIARRGIPYGNKEKDDSVGLLFLCAQSNIASQFEFIQNAWSNKNSFFNDDTGIDPVTGQGNQQDGGQWWPIKRKDTKKIQFDFSRCVWLQGGEYFYAPSISFLKNLVNDQIGIDSN